MRVKVKPGPQKASLGDKGEEKVLFKGYVEMEVLPTVKRARLGRESSFKKDKDGKWVELEDLDALEAQMDMLRAGWVKEVK